MVWRRPDLDFEAGAKAAAELLECVEEIAGTQAGAAILDVRQAPSVTGPKTQGCIALMLKAWVRVVRPMAVVVSSGGLQALQYQRLITENAPRLGRVFEDIQVAERWVLEFQPP